MDSDRKANIPEVKRGKQDNEENNGGTDAPEKDHVNRELNKEKQDGPDDGKEPCENGDHALAGVPVIEVKQPKDAAWVKRDEDGKPKVKQAVNLVGKGALGGAFWGMLIGLLFLAPWLGAAIGAASGALGGKVADFGIDDDFIKTVGNRIQPGTSALFLLTRDAVVDKVVDALKGYDFEIIHTNLPTEQEAELRAAFADA